MKEYDSVITMLAELAFSRYMGGGYNVSEETVNADLQNKFEQIKAEYYKHQ